jgi:hypothetical protein
MMRRSTAGSSHHRLSLVIAAVAVAAFAFVAQPAFAATLSGSEQVPRATPLIGDPGSDARAIESLSSTFDRSSGTWTVVLRFYGPQSHATEGELYLNLLGPKRDERYLAGAWTDPGDSRPT